MSRILSFVTKSLMLVIVGVITFISVSLFAMLNDGPPINGKASLLERLWYELNKIMMKILVEFLKILFEILRNLFGNQSSGTQPSSSDFTVLATILQYILVFIMTILVIYVLHRLIKSYRRSASDPKVKTDKRERVENLKFSREKAREILINSKATGEYTSGVILAYQELDSALDNFREAKRPKHWTPKEYAFSVKEPLFKPNVYRIVNVFYKTRYAEISSTLSDVDEFLQALDMLFVSENSPEEKSRLQTFFDKEFSKERHWNIIPTGDVLKPKKLQEYTLFKLQEKE